jgi:hypothetical protein
MGKTHGHALVFLLIGQVKRIEPALELVIGIGLKKMLAKGVFHDDRLLCKAVF